MKKDGWLNLQDDILKKRGIYIAYAFVFIASFVVSLENAEIFTHLMRIFLIALALICLVVIYFKCGETRSKHENRAIIYNIIFFLILGAAVVSSMGKSFIGV